MRLFILQSCGGANFSYQPKQVVEEADPTVGADLVKHGLAIEIDAEGKPVVVTPAASTDENQLDDSDEAETEDDQAEDQDNDQADESETADGSKVDESTPETATPDQSSTESAVVNPPAETATVTNAPVRRNPRRK
ncbi:hypothetical protein [Spirosoma sp. KNUC1025]|uniref:hypothetical protein n=1 Tax=Spirosoma sp. KNUC1025 TaxID=2894082 RepID=UPI00386C03CB|nr:hypothetical protein LN737_19240 [Spirosoma sp. KNUC1025]